MYSTTSTIDITGMTPIVVEGDRAELVDGVISNT